MNDIIRPRTNTLIAFDFETNGLVDFRAPSDAAHQPHTVQIGAVLYDLDAREEVETFEVIIRPTDWIIPDEVAAIHGITTERALDEGIPEALAFDELLRLWSPDAPRPRVAHNRSFDDRIARIGLKRFMGVEAADAWKAAPGYCTAILSTPIVKLPPTDKMKAARRFHYKTPTLTEAHQHFFGEAFDGAHSALADCRACLRVYLAILDQQQPARAAA